ncbi:Hexose carrier protein HEX6, partial [Linum perenne]
LVVNQEKARKVLEQIRGTSEIESELEDLTLASQISISINDPFRTILKIKYRPQLVMTVAISFFQQSPESTSSPSTLRSSSVQSEWGKALLRCPPFQSAQSESNLPLNADRRQDEETEAILHRGSPDVRILDPRRRDHGGGAGRPRRDRCADNQLRHRIQTLMGSTRVAGSERGFFDGDSVGGAEYCGGGDFLFTFGGWVVVMME